MFLIKCSYCPNTCQRIKDVKTATCYECRLKQRQERARKYHAQLIGKFKQYKKNLCSK